MARAAGYHFSGERKSAAAAAAAAPPLEEVEDEEEIDDEEDVKFLLDKNDRRLCFRIELNAFIESRI
jgi:hypothetical protein